MSKNARRLLYWGFVSIFVIVAPILLLLSAGWRLNFARWSIQRTGLLLVTTDDRDVRVSLNGGRANGTYRDHRLWFSQLFPGAVTVNVQKDGFHAWEKSYVINEGLATFSSPVVLFPDTSPRKIASGSFQFVPQTRLDDAPILTSNNPTGGQWVLNRDQADLIALTNDTNSAKPHEPPFALVPSPNGVLLTKAASRRAEHPTTLATLPTGSWMFTAAPEGFVSAYDNHARRFFFYDERRASEWMRSPIVDAQWNTDGILATIGDNELNVLHTKDGTTETSALGLPGVRLALPRHIPIILLADHTTVHARERDVADPLDTTLFELTSIDAMALSQDEKNLIVIGADENGPGVFLYPLPS